ncbi:MAG: hypothetical protein ACR2L3_03795 [Actinomycetota bacterium]
MSRAIEEPQKSLADLTEVERDALKAAHKRLQDAVHSYDKFLGVELKPGVDVPMHRMEDMAAAQREIDEAEAELWRVREELLDWRRPGWAQSATSVADWFSEEDADYDNYQLPSSA